MMEKIDVIENKLDKKKWFTPTFQIIKFKETKGGPHESSNEDLVYGDPFYAS